MIIEYLSCVIYHQIESVCLVSPLSPHNITYTVKKFSNIYCSNKSLFLLFFLSCFLLLNITFVSPFTLKVNFGYTILNCFFLDSVYVARGDKSHISTYTHANRFQPVANHLYHLATWIQSRTVVLYIPS